MEYYLLLFSIVVEIIVHRVGYFKRETAIKGQGEESEKGKREYLNTERAEKSQDEERPKWVDK